MEAEPWTDDFRARWDQPFDMHRDAVHDCLGPGRLPSLRSSRRTAATLELGDEVTGRGSRAEWALDVQVLRELTHHNGHAGILREQILAARPE